MWARQCHACQLSKVQRHTSAPLSKFLPPDARFDHVHIDLVGPLPSSYGCTYLLTCVDPLSRWPEAHPQPDCMADSWCSICLELLSNSGGLDYEILSVVPLGPWLLLCPLSARSLSPHCVPSHLYSLPHQIDRRRRKEGN